MPPEKYSAVIRHLPGMALLAVFGLFLGAPCEAENISGADFDIVYRPHALPEKSAPPWKRVGSIQRELIEVNGEPVLQMASELAGTGYYEMSDLTGGEVPDFSESGKGLTVECLLRVDSQEGDKGAVAIRMSDKNWLFLLQCDKDGIWPYKHPQQKVSLPLGEEFQKIRIVVPPGADVALVYVNDDPSEVLSISRIRDDKERSHVAWGDIGASMGGQTSWKYVAFTNHGAFSPSKQ